MTGGSKFSLRCLALAAACAVPQAFAQEVPIDIATLKDSVVAQTNAYRGSKKVPELRPNAALDAAATAYALYLAEHEGGGHTADGKTPAKRAFAQGYRWCLIAENVWSGWRKPDPMMVNEVVRSSMDGWKKSPGHNRNLIDSKIHDIGIGAAAWKQPGGRTVFRVVQLFGDECPGKPRPAPSIGELIDEAAEVLP